MRKQIVILLLVVISIAGCTVNSSGISFRWPVPVQPNQNKKTVVDPKKVVGHEFRCLIIEDVDARSKLPKSQLSMLTGKNLRDFLKANCVKDSAGNPQFRIIDKSTQLTGVWKEMRDGPVPNNAEIPYPILILKNGDEGKIRSLPTDWAELQSELEYFAGVSP
jgi:hypothetical protein